MGVKLNRLRLAMGTLDTRRAITNSPVKIELGRRVGVQDPDPLHVLFRWQQAGAP